MSAYDMSPSVDMVSGVANFSRSFAASASGRMVPTAPISTTILPAAAWSFFTSSACTSSRNSQRVRGSMRPMMPKSKNTMRPRSSTYRLPACRSPWNRPCRRPPSKRLNSKALTSSVPSKPALRVAAASSMHLLGGVVPVRLRHPDVLAQRRRVQVRHPGVHRLRLEAEVQFLGQVVAEVGDHVLGGQPAAQLGQLHGLSEALEDLQIGGHPAADARPLDLDHDFLAAVQGGVVHLGDGRRRERLLFEAGEQLRWIAAEVLGE